MHFHWCACVAAHTWVLVPTRDRFIAYVYRTPREQLSDSCKTLFTCSSAVCASPVAKQCVYTSPGKILQQKVVNKGETRRAKKVETKNKQRRKNETKGGVMRKDWKHVRVSRYSYFEPLAARCDHTRAARANWSRDFGRAARIPPLDAPLLGQRGGVLVNPSLPSGLNVLSWDACYLSAFDESN